jgi:hypothetical protein
MPFFTVSAVKTSNLTIYHLPEASGLYLSKGRSADQQQWRRIDNDEVSQRLQSGERESKWGWAAQQIGEDGEWRMPSSGMLRCMRRLLVTANLVPSSPILVTLMLEALSSSETSVLTRAIRRNIPEDGILHSHRRENHKSYKYHVVPYMECLLLCNSYLAFGHRKWHDSVNSLLAHRWI